MAYTINFYRQSLPSTCIDFSSLRGKQVFQEALDTGYMNAYFKLGPQLRTQDDPAYCGLSSLVMVLNAFAVDPGKVWKGVWRWYHEDMLACCVSLEYIKKHGLSRQQLSCVAKCNQLNSTLIYANDRFTLDAFRKTVKEVCQTGDFALVLSFRRKIIGQSGGGHFAPVGGYCPKGDLVLMLDPARFKYPPFWVELPLLFEAMQTIDGVTGKPRGYLRLSQQTSQPTLLFQLARNLNVFLPLDTDFGHFLTEALRYLKNKAPSNAKIDGVIIDVSNHLSKLASSHKGIGRSLFFTVAKQSDINSLSPEHQVAITFLVKAIENTEIYQFISKSNQIQKEVKIELARINCASKTCVLCLPHYLTLMFCMLPLFTPGNSGLAQFALNENAYRGSSLELLVDVVERVLRKISDDLHAGGQNGEEASRRRQSSRLLLNEIEQLQTQMRHVLNVGTGAHSICCGNEQSIPLAQTRLC